MPVSLDDPTARAALERLHRLCVDHARGASKITRDLREKKLSVLPRARRLMLEARANLEQWRVAVLRIDALEESEREMVEMLMSVARRDVEASYSMIARTLSGVSALHTLEYALRRTRRAMMAVLVELARLTEGGDEVLHLQREDLELALRCRREYGVLALALEGLEGPFRERFVEVRGLLSELLGKQESIAMRLGDVEAFEQLLGRLSDWLERPDDVPGEQLWSEVESVVALLRGINQRETLKSHDRGRLGALAGSLDAPIAGLKSELDTLFGLDPVLDSLLARFSPTLNDSEVQRLRQRIGELFDLV